MTFVKKLAILGSTGSIGNSTLSICESFPDRYQVISLAAGRNIDAAFDQCLRWRPKVISVATEKLATDLTTRLRAAGHTGTDVLHGTDHQEFVTGRVSDCYHRCYHRYQEVVAVAALNIRNLNETVKRRLQVRAARHGRSMEAEVRAILEEAVREPADSAGLFTALLDRFGALGGVDLDLPGRDEPARAADFSA